VSTPGSTLGSFLGAFLTNDIEKFEKKRQLVHQAQSYGRSRGRGCPCLWGTAGGGVREGAPLSSWAEHLPRKVTRVKC